MTHLVRDAVTSVSRRWRRNLLSIAAVGVGAAAVFSIVGISNASAQRVADRIDALESTSVTASLPRTAWTSTEAELISGAEQLSDVESAGTLVLPDAGAKAVTVRVGQSRQDSRLSTVIATPEGLRSRDARFVSGGMPAAAFRHADPFTVVIGQAVARQLHIGTEEGSSRLIVNGRDVAVTGIVADGASSATLDASIVMSPETAAALEVQDAPRVVLVRVKPGSGPGVVRQLAAALYPVRAGEVGISSPPSPQKLRAQLLADSQTLEVVVTAVMAGATVFSIVTTMQISVWERRREIGVSRALGMSRGRVASMFLVESTALGAIGGLAGWAIGALVVGAVSAIGSWPLTVPPLLMFLPAFAALIGGVAGVAPAISASRVDPAELLRA